jgi:hypothetical protein
MEADLDRDGKISFEEFMKMVDDEHDSGPVLDFPLIGGLGTVSPGTSFGEEFWVQWEDIESVHIHQTRI